MVREDSWKPEARERISRDLAMSAARAAVTRSPRHRARRPAHRAAWTPLREAAPTPRPEEAVEGPEVDVLYSRSMSASCLCVCGGRGWRCRERES